MNRNLLNKLIYENPLSSPADVKDFRLEGQAAVTFPNGRMRLKNILDAEEGQKANYLFWCPEEFPSDIKITWDFCPVSEPGLCMMFFAAKGINGEDIFAPGLNKRDGRYNLYHNGDINAFHVSYFRRNPSERRFNTCNLRKSKGFHLVAQGGDPIPSIIYADPPYHMTIIKLDNVIEFIIDDVPIFKFIDDGTKYGPLLGGGKIGFRQMAPMTGEYANLKVFTSK